MRRISITLLCLCVALGAVLWLVHDAPAPRRSTTEKSIAVQDEPARASSGARSAPATQEPVNEVRVASAREVVAQASEPVAPPSAASTDANGAALTGQVLDDSGAPVRRFYLSYVADLEGRGWEALSAELAPRQPPRGALTKLVTDPKGRFQIDGLQSGAWLVKAFAEGYVETSWTSARVPGPRIALVLAHPTRVSGVVLDRRGDPVADAEVRTVLGQEPPVATDVQGAFVLPIVGASATLFATHAGHAQSRPLPLDFSPGESVTGVELRLRDPGTIEGDVLGADGQPSAAVALVARCEHELFQGDARTDRTGHFVLKDLPPGDYELLGYVAATPGDEERAIRTESLGHLRENVVLREGETAHVRFVLEVPVTIRLHGRVRAGDAPMANAFVAAARLVGTSDSGFHEVAEVDGGTYELALPGPGRYGLSVELGSLSWRTSVEVPDAPEHTFDLTVPVGRISGRVLSFDGKPLANLAVRSEPERHGDDGHGSARTSSNAEGQYELVVPAGLHAVCAGGADPRVPGGADPLYAEARVGGLEVEPGARLTGIDLVLSEGAKLDGRVRFADGSPAADAELWSFAAPRPRSLGRSARDGSFHLAGLASGSLALAASRDDAATRERTLVQLSLGSTPHVELVLEPAVRIHVLARAAGVVVGCELALVDAHGITFPVRSDRPGEAWFGPLATGNYVVSARNGTQHAERVLALDGTEKKLEVELALE